MNEELITFLNQMISQPLLDSVIGVPMTAKFTRAEIEHLIKPVDDNSAFNKNGGFVLRMPDGINMVLSVATYWDLPNARMPHEDLGTITARMSREIVKTTSPFAHDDATSAKSDLIFFKTWQIKNLLENADGIRFRRTFCFFNHPNGGHDCWYENLIAEPTPKGLFDIYRRNDQPIGSDLTNYEYGFACPPNWEPITFTIKLGHKSPLSLFRR
jgi:hypothetical protein